MVLYALCRQIGNYFDLKYVYQLLVVFYYFTMFKKKNFSLNDDTLFNFKSSK